MNILEPLAILMSVAFGYWLRDLNRKALRIKPLSSFKHKPDNTASTFIEYEPPISEQEQAEKQARANTIEV